MLALPHAGRVRLYVDNGQVPKQATELVARMVELGIAESAIHEVRRDFNADADESSAFIREIVEDAQAVNVGPKAWRPSGGPMVGLKT